MSNANHPRAIKAGYCLMLMLADLPSGLHEGTMQHLPVKVLLGGR